MYERKITKTSFDRGALRKTLNTQERAANLSDKGRERVEAALKAGVEREAKKHGLQYGVGSNHADALQAFPSSKKYTRSLDPSQKLKPKELAVVKGSLDVFFNRKPVAPKSEIKAPARIMRRVAPPPAPSAPKTEQRSPEPLPPFDQASITSSPPPPLSS